MKSSLEQLKEKLLKNNKYRKEVNKQDLPFEIAERIIDARIKKGMTQAELAKKLKTKQSGVARLESGRNYPSLKSLEKIAQILDIKLKDLVFLEEELPALILPANWLVNSGSATYPKAEESKPFCINN